MTLLTVLPELPLMRIIPLMARDAAGRRRHHLRHRIFMTGLALNSRMRALQLIFRLRIMIKLP